MPIARQMVGYVSIRNTFGENSYRDAAVSCPSVCCIGEKFMCTRLVDAFSPLLSARSDHTVLDAREIRLALASLLYVERLVWP